MPRTSPGRARKPKREPARPAAREAVLPLDAEDIALARLQAQLRRRETIQPPAGGGGETAVGRTSLRLPEPILRLARERARRQRVTLSAVVQAALDHYLRAH